LHTFKVTRSNNYIKEVPPNKHKLQSPPEIFDQIKVNEHNLGLITYWQSNLRPKRKVTFSKIITV